MKKLRAPFLCILFLVSCAGAQQASQEPWEETELSHAITTWKQPSFQGEKLVLDDHLKRHLGPSSPRPNLFDLHAPNGAVAQAQRRSGQLVVKILEATGEDVQILDEFNYIFRGHTYDLWHRDKTQVNLPTSRYRWPPPREMGLLAYAEPTVRVTNGRDMSRPIDIRDVPEFAKALQSEYVNAPLPRKAVEQSPVTVRVSKTHGITVDWHDMTSLAEQIQGKPVLLAPSAEEPSYGDFVALLDKLYHVAANGQEVLFAVETLGYYDNDPKLFSPLTLPSRAIEGPILGIKADAETPWSHVETLLHHLESQGIDRVVLLTDLNVAVTSWITAETHPGGLPGGLVLPLNPPSL